MKRRNYLQLIAAALAWPFAGLWRKTQAANPVTEDLVHVAQTKTVSTGTACAMDLRKDLGGLIRLIGELNQLIDNCLEEGASRIELGVRQPSSYEDPDRTLFYITLNAHRHSIGRLDDYLEKQRQSREFLKEHGTVMIHECRVISV